MGGTIRLVNGTNATEGTVEVCIGTRYGTVCDDHWDELDEERGLQTVVLFSR